MPCLSGRISRHSENTGSRQNVTRGLIAIGRTRVRASPRRTCWIVATVAAQMTRTHIRVTPSDATDTRVHRGTDNAHLAVYTGAGPTTYLARAQVQPLPCNVRLPVR